jgi:L-threonylcarbamoyladenylate synthase
MAKSTATASGPSIDAAVAALGRGEIIGLPTETVYGLAGDAANPDAVRRIFALKGRPADHPVIVHLGDVRWLDTWARDIPATAGQLAERFWPGPLTMILRRAATVSDLVTGGQDTVGLRIPSHPVALAVLRGFGRGLAAPSANRFGHLSPTRAEHVRAEFGADLPLVLDGGPCPIGIESTIVDLSGNRPRVLRPGNIPVEALAAALNGPVATSGTGGSPRVSGSLRSHYAPRARAELVARAQLEQRLAEVRSSKANVRVLAIGELPGAAQGLALPDVPDDYARQLYAALRTLDSNDVQEILIEAPPSSPAWLAVRDRLARATAGVRDVES